jgi:hypothetical protein
MSGRPTPASARRLTSLDRSTWALVAFAVLLSGLVVYAMRDSIIDDGYINLGYVRRLSQSFEWGMLPGVPSNTATSPLNVMVTSLVAVVVRDPMVAMWIVSIATAAMLAIGLLQLSRLWLVGRRFAWIGVALLVLNPLLASSLGLETMAAVTLIVWLLCRAAAGDWRGYGWLCGVGVLLRTDLALVMAVIWLLHPVLWRPDTLAKIWATTWRACLVAVPWFAFSWVYFGSAIPDTFAMKTLSKRTWGGPFAYGLQDKYLPDYPLAVWAVYVTIGAGLIGLIALFAFRRTRFHPVLAMVASAGLAGIAYFALYCWLSVPPYFWYYGIPIGCLVLVASWVISAGSEALLARYGVGWVRIGAAVAAVAVMAPTAASWARELSRSTPLGEAPIHGNWALPSQYKQIGLDLKERLPEGAVVRSAGEFATILYYCDCTLTDRFDERASVRETLLEARNDGSALMKLNYLLYDPSKYERQPVDFHLRYDLGWTDDPTAWNVYSPTRGRGHFTLIEGPKKAAPSQSGTNAP